MKNLTVTKPFDENDYNELLQQAVAVIETSRLRIYKDDYFNGNRLYILTLSAGV